MSTALPTALARELAVKYQVDPRSIQREHRSPGTVRGMAGDRARAALRSVGLSPPTAPTNTTTARGTPGRTETKESHVPSR
jgi:hypothetical protein